MSASAGAPNSEQVQPPRPLRSKLFLARLGAAVPQIVPLLAFTYAFVTLKPVPPFSRLPQYPSQYRRELFRSWLYRHPTILRLATVLRRKPIGPPTPDETATFVARSNETDVSTPMYGPTRTSSLRDALRRSSMERPAVLFLHHAYYHFYYLAAALRKRGWHALSVSCESPTSGNQPYYHGEDINLYDADWPTMSRRLMEFYDCIPGNFDLLHWHGETMTAVFPENFNSLARDSVPWDFLELKRRGVKLGFSISGCLTGTKQSDFNRVSAGVCDKCVWQLDPIVCSDAKNDAVGKMLGWICDLIAVEGDWPIAPYRRTSRAFLEPLIYCLDADLWRPGLVVPDHMRFDRADGEILIFHAVGNYDVRARLTRNIKGTGAVLAAVERLRAEGIPARLIFKTGVPSRDMRFYQTQADIVVDQLNYGRYGATARECMMLGKPTVTHLVREQPLGQPQSPSLAECPLISANEESIYDVLKDLCLSPAKRASIGRTSREYALKWHSADRCAERFEQVFENMRRGRPVRTGIY